MWSVQFGPTPRLQKVPSEWRFGVATLKWHAVGRSIFAFNSSECLPAQSLGRLKSQGGSPDSICIGNVICKTYSPALSAPLAIALGTNQVCANGSLS
jgi:hypothetical protein